MPATLSHFSINADDVGRARRFYEAVMGWTYEPWGPPDYYQARGAGTAGALQERREIAGRPQSVEVTFGVDDLAQTMAAIEANGGKLLTRPFRIEGVGELVWFEDTEGNVLGAMKYDREAGR